MKISKLNQFNHTDNTSAGFTLIELLVSISIMGVVFALVGTGITFMVSADQKLAAAQSLRTEISHALDVISYDIRKAENVNGLRNSPTPAATVTAAIGASPPLNLSVYTPVLFLNISIICSDNTIVSEPVIYSTKANAEDGRVGSHVLYRYGRIADKDDKIPCSSVAENAPIADNITPATTPPTCVAPAATTPAATREGANGFYTCVSDNQVSIALFAKLTDTLIYGDNRTITSGSISSTSTVVGGSLTTATAADNCTVPDLLTTPTTPSAANTTILTESLPYKGLSYTGIATSGGTNVVSQTPSAGSKIPCKTGLITYTY